MLKTFFYFSMWTYSVKAFSVSSHWQADSIKSPTIIMFTFFFFEKLENSDHLRVFKSFTLAKINLGKPEPVPWSGKKKNKMNYIIFSLALLLKLLKTRREAGSFLSFLVKWDVKKKKNYGYRSNFSTSVFIMYYLLFKIETSVCWTSNTKLFNSNFFLAFLHPLIKCYLVTFGLHCCFELEQIYPRSPITVLSSRRRKKKIIWSCYCWVI